MRRIVGIGSKLKVKKPKNFKAPTTKVDTPEVNTKVQEISTPKAQVIKPKVIGVKTNNNLA